METTDLVKWLTGDSELGNGGGLIERLKASPDGLDSIADGIADFIGETGKGGLLKCIADYDQECKLNLGDMGMALTLETDSLLEATVEMNGVPTKIPINAKDGKLVVDVKLGDGSNPFFEGVFKKIFLAYLIKLMAED